MAAVTLSGKVLSAKTIICDIEGTTTSISFVKDTLFPYALKNVEDYLKKNWNEDATKTVVAALREQAEEDKTAEVEGVVAIPAGDSKDIIEDIVKSVEWQMSLDRKTGSLKTLQGLVWAEGYKDGTIKGHVYDDVQKAFEDWTECGRKIYIYSSGSVDAQKLLFENSEKGNLQKYLAGHYDTKIGAKREKESYQSILKNIESTAEEALFLTDVFAEAKAAKEAGLNVVLLDRPGNAEFSEEERKEFPVIKTFSDLSFEEAKEENGAALNGKRKIEEATGTTEEDKAQEPPSKVVKVEAAITPESVANGAVDDKEIISASDTGTSSKKDEASEKEGEKMDVDDADKESNLDKNKDETEKMRDVEDVKAEKLQTNLEEKKEKEIEKVDSKEHTDKISDVKVPVETQSIKDSTAAMDVDEQDSETKATKESDDTKDSRNIEDSKKIDNSEKNENLAEVNKSVDANDVKELKKDKEVKETGSKAIDSTDEKQEVAKEESEKEKSMQSSESKTADKKEEEEPAIGVKTKSSVVTDVVATEVGEDSKTEKAAASSGESEKEEKTTGTVDAAATSDKTEPAPSTNGEEAGVKVASTNSEKQMTDEKPTTNGSSAGDAEKHADSDKENDTSLNNCETDDVPVVVEKTNGSTSVEGSGNSVQETAVTAEIKPKKVADIVASAATPTPPIEAES